MNQRLTMPSGSQAMTMPMPKVMMMNSTQSPTHSSPYQNVRAGQRLPHVLLTTSTRDDRVHPGHARKMAARLLEQGHDMLYYENIEGGHGGAADNAQRADMLALEFSFLWQHVKA